MGGRIDGRVELGVGLISGKESDRGGAGLLGLQTSYKAAIPIHLALLSIFLFFRSRIQCSIKYGIIFEDCLEAPIAKISFSCKIVLRIV